jgi:hypothetical protein
MPNISRSAWVRSTAIPGDVLRAVIIRKNYSKGGLWAVTVLIAALRCYQSRASRIGSRAAKVCALIDQPGFTALMSQIRLRGFASAS